MAKFGHKITLSDRAYENFRKLKQILGAKSWEELSEKLLEIVERMRSGEATNTKQSKRSCGVGSVLSDEDIDQILDELGEQR